jgi:hypothetical protein
LLKSLFSENCSFEEVGDKALELFGPPRAMSLNGVHISIAVGRRQVERPTTKN